MNLVTLEWLLSPPGQALLAELAVRPLREVDALHELTRLRRQYAPEQATAAFELSLLRQRARAKFPAAERMYFTREALEQASAAPVAAWRAQRLAPCGQVADLGCSIGGDALALAAAGASVTAVDRDELRLALAAANAAALGLSERIRWICADLTTSEPPAAAALFCDPARRSGGKRTFDPASYAPPLDRVLSWREHTPALAIKLAPGIDPTELPQDAEIEFVSLAGELKEAVLWSGPLAQTSRRATLLQSTPTGEPIALTLVTAEAPAPTLSEPLAFLYEPDPAIIRAGLVAQIAAQIDAAQLDPSIAYLTSATHSATPYARAWPILEWLPFQLKRLRARIRALDGGAVTVKKRGSPLDSDALARQLSGDGSQSLVVVLTRLRGEPITLICTDRV
jgi:SAM-dependent methyltransferase